MPKRATALTPATLHVDRGSDKVPRRQIYEQIRQAILDGTLKPGSRLPSTRDLARELRISRNSVVGAFRFLASHGLIEGRTGAGTRVAAAVRACPRIPASNGPRAGRPARIRRVVVDASSGAAGPFRPGVPAVDLFPAAVWSRLLGRRWRAAKPAELAYPGRAADRALCEAIAAWAGIARGIRCDPEQVIVVCGAQHAIDLASRVLLDPGDTACVEDPGYGGARGAFATAGARVIGVPVDAGGIDAAAGRARSAAPRLIYVTPAHQYPLGAILAPQRRRELLEWAASCGAWVIEDDFGGEFQYRRDALRPLFASDSRGCVLYIGTFSQSLAPALHVGYAIVPHDLIDAFELARSVSRRGISLVEQRALTDFISGGHLARHIRLLRAEYEQRQEALKAALRPFDGIVRLTGDEAGTHLLASLRPGTNDAAVAAAAARRGIEAPTLRAHAVTAPCPPALVLGYGSTPCNQIPGAAARLAEVLR